MTTTAPTPVSTSAATAPRRRARWPFVLGAILLLIVGTYAFAWLRAYRLSVRFMENARESFSAQEYLNALTGYETFDEAQGRYVYRGGYAQVVRIWEDPYAWPKPAAVGEARARVDEIINQRLSLEEAETFIQENIGQANPYLGRIYLRTGELYEEEGDPDTAAEVFEEVAELFPNNPELIARAEENLARLEGGE